MTTSPATGTIIPEWWDDAWAEETLNVCERVYWTQRKTIHNGAYTSAGFKDIDEHFRGWLIEEALELRSQLDTTTLYPDQPIETQWYAILHTALTKAARWHLTRYAREHGIPQRQVAYAWTTTSTDYLTEETGDSWVPTKWQNNHDLLTKDPLKILLFLEGLQAGTHETDYTKNQKNENLCSWENCTRPATTKGMCAAHREAHRQLWGHPDAKKCVVAGCPDYSITRERCATHYSKLKNEAKAAGTWVPRTPQNTAPCAREGCYEPANTKGLCTAHYDAQRRGSTANPCSEPNCPYVEYKETLCTRHWRKKREAQGLPALARDQPCKSSNCGNLVGKRGARGMCVHCYNQWLKQRKKKDNPNE